MREFYNGVLSYGFTRRDSFCYSLFGGSDFGSAAGFVIILFKVNRAHYSAPNRSIKQSAFNIYISILVFSEDIMLEIVIHRRIYLCNFLRVGVVEQSFRENQIIC